MSENHLILVECPLVTHPLRVLVSARPFIDTFRWSPDRGTRLTIVDKDNGAIVRTVTTDPYFAFHVVNAFESDGCVVLDVVAHDTADVVETLFLERLRAGGGRVEGALTRFVIPLDSGPVTRQTLSDLRLELPHTDAKRRAAHAYRHVWGVGQTDDQFMNRLQKYDLSAGTTSLWSAPGCFPGEPVFVAAPDSESSGEGVILSVVLDATAKRSCLLVLDALTMQEVARAWTPHAIPFGFHGGYYPEPQAILAPDRAGVLAAAMAP